MRFIVDECTGSRVASWLRSQGHDVVSIFDDARGLRDRDILEIAVRESRIVITNDKGYGIMVFVERRQHRGVVLLRLGDQRAASKIAALTNVLERFGDVLEGQFVVVSETMIRFGPDRP